MRDMEELQKSHVIKVEELSRRKLTEDFEEVTSFFQGSNVKTVYILSDNDAKYPDAEIDDEHTRNSLASPLYLQEREASASLLQVHHSQKRKLVSRCTVNFSKYGETRRLVVTKSANLTKSSTTVRSGSFLERQGNNCSQKQNPRPWDMNTERILPKIIFVSWRDIDSQAVKIGHTRTGYDQSRREQAPLHEEVQDRERALRDIRIGSGTVFGARNAPPKRRECLGRTGSQTSGDRGQVEIQSLCHESRSRVDQFIHDGRTHSTRGDCQRRTVAQRSAFPFAENCDTGRSPAELVTPRETFVAAAHREPDLADRADEAAEAEVDEETPSPAQQGQLLRAHVNLEHPTIGEFSRALRNGRCRWRVVRWAKRYFKCPECEARPMPRTRPAATLPKCYRFNQVCGIDTMEVRNRWIENPIQISHVICHGTRYHQGARRQDMTVTETFSTLRQFWLKHNDAKEVLIMDQGTEFGVNPGVSCLWWLSWKRHGKILSSSDMELYSKWH